MMEKDRNWILALVYLCLLVFAVVLYQSKAFSDVIHLKNGRKMTGIIERQDDERIFLRIRMGVIGVNRDEIEKIEKINDKGKEAVETEEKEKWSEADKRRKEFEAKQIKRGLVKYQGLWVTPEEKAEQELPKIKISNCRIYKDGKPFFIKGIDYSLNYPKMARFQDIPESIWEKDFQMIKELGANTIRTYAPLPPKLLDLAEKYNLMVIETIIYPNSKTNYDSEEEREKLINEALRIVRRDKLRPSILMWNIWNDAPFHWEPAGNVVSRFGFGKVNQFLKEIYQAIKTEDTKHPVTGSNILDLPGYNLGFDFLDAIGIHAFVGLGRESGWFEGIYTQSKARADIDKMVNVSQEYDKPVYIAETGYSTFCKGGRQGEIIKRQIINTGENLSGIIIFEWADEWWKAGNPRVQDNHIEEHWGITDAYRNPKPGYQGVSDLFRTIQTESRGYSR